MAISGDTYGTWVRITSEKKTKQASDNVVDAYVDETTTSQDNTFF